MASRRPRAIADRARRVDLDQFLVQRAERGFVCCRVLVTCAFDAPTAVHSKTAAGTTVFQRAKALMDTPKVDDVEVCRNARQKWWPGGTSRGSEALGGAPRASRGYVLAKDFSALLV